jgi:hypothetical protein
MSDEIETWQHLHEQHADVFDDERTCLNQSDECVGPVEFRPCPPRGERSFPRCEFHHEQRWAQYDDPDSIERWADSDVPPPWFDPMDAGERWNEDD